MELKEKGRIRVYCICYQSEDLGFPWNQENWKSNNQNKKKLINFSKNESLYQIDKTFNPNWSKYIFLQENLIWVTEFP